MHEVLGLFAFVTVILVVIVVAWKLLGLFIIIIDDPVEEGTAPLDPVALNMDKVRWENLPSDLSYPAQCNWVLLEVQRVVERGELFLNKSQMRTFSRKLLDRHLET